MKNKRLLSVLIVVAMVVSLVPAVLVGAAAQEGEKYPITVTETEGSKVSTSVSEAAEYDSVKLTFDMLAGSMIKQITVTDAIGTILIIYSDEEGYRFQMPASAVTVTAVFGPFGSPQIMKFTDVPDDAEYYDAVYYCYTHDFMIGTGDGTTFSPDMKLTRAMAATVLYRVSGETVAEDTGNKFTDVEAGSWYEDAVNWAAAKELTFGVGDNKFNPEGELTHEQWLTMMYRYSLYKKYDQFAAENTNILSYEDVFEVSKWAMPAYQWACGTGIIFTEVTNLYPATIADRAFLAMTIKNMGVTYGIY